MNMRWKVKYRFSIIYNSQKMEANLVSIDRWMDKEDICIHYGMILSRTKDGESNRTPLQYSCLENPMDGETWWAAVHGVAKSRTRLSDFTFTFHFHALEKEMATHSSVLLENPRDGGAWWAAVYGVAQSQTQLKRLSSSSIYSTNIC